MIRVIDYQGYNIHTSSEGTGEKIIFLHGWPTNSKLWQAQVDEFKSSHQVITLDWLGFGQSDKPIAHTYSFTDYKNILNTVIAAYISEGEKITLIAHDIGGPPTILWASENPERVNRLILLNTVIYPFRTLLDAISETTMDLPILKDVFVSPFGLKMVMKTNTRSRGGEINQKINAILAPLEKVDAQLKIKTIHQPLHDRKNSEMASLSQKYCNLNAEKHLIIAKKDPLCYQHIKKLSEENPEIPTYLIPNCGHFMAIDRPDAVNRVLGEILA